MGEFDGDVAGRGGLEGEGVVEWLLEAHHPHVGLLGHVNEVGEDAYLIAAALHLAEDDILRAEPGGALDEVALFSRDPELGGVANDAVVILAGGRELLDDVFGETAAEAVEGRITGFVIERSDRDGDGRRRGGQELTPEDRSQQSDECEGERGDDQDSTRRFWRFDAVFGLGSRRFSLDPLDRADELVSTAGKGADEARGGGLVR